MGEARVTNPLVEEFRVGRVPKDLRLMAAQGALPLKTTDLVELLYYLLKDRDDDVKKTAMETLRALPASELIPLFKDRETPPALLGWGLANREEQELREGLLQNHSTPDDAIESLAGSLPPELAELVVINQVRLLRSMALLVTLEGNPNLNKDQRRRLRELRETFHIGEEPAAAPAPPLAPEPTPEALPEEVEETPEVPLTEAEALLRYLDDIDREQPEKVSSVQRIYRLNTAEKVITALKGTREERAVLVRDPNRIVSTAVLGSPRLTDVEVESFAAMKNLSSEVLRQIGSHREWTRRYGVISSLVRNPRTPLGLSLGMVSRLTPRDLKSLSFDRNVPEVIRKQALKFMREEGGGKKH
jgi:hypothetical protein